MAAMKKAANAANGNGTNKGDFDDTDRIVLFKHGDATEANRKPVLSGRVNVGGVDYRVSLWPKTSASGLRFYSGQIQLADTAARPVKAAAPAVTDDEFP